MQQLSLCAGVYLIVGLSQPAPPQGSQQEEKMGQKLPAVSPPVSSAETKQQLAISLSC